MSTCTCRTDGDGYHVPETVLLCPACQAEEDVQAGLDAIEARAFGDWTCPKCEVALNGDGDCPSCLQERAELDVALWEEALAGVR